MSDTYITDWGLSATSGIAGADIDYDFFDSLSNAELILFGSNLQDIREMYENEIKSRGI